jgi:hypothetical protein
MITSPIDTVRKYLQGDGAIILPELELFLFALGILIIDRWIWLLPEFVSADSRCGCCVATWSKRERIGAIPSCWVFTIPPSWTRCFFSWR